MNNDARRKLEARRRALQNKLALEERRSLLEYHTNDLDAAGVRYEVIFDTEDLAKWVTDRWPTHSKGVVWTEHDHCECHSMHHTIGLLLEEILPRLDSSPTDKVEVLFANARTPALKMRVSDVIAHGQHLESDFEVWIICRHRGWLLEFIHDRGWCLGFEDSSPPWSVTLSSEERTIK